MRVANVRPLILDKELVFVAYDKASVRLFVHILSDQMLTVPSRSWRAISMENGKRDSIVELLGLFSHFYPLFFL